MKCSGKVDGPRPPPIIGSVRGGFLAAFRIFLKSLRLPFLTGSLLPVTVATALAYWLHQAFNLGFFGLNMLGVAALHLGANLINDYYDAFGSDPLNRNFTPFSGGSRVIQDRELEAETVKTLAYFFLALGMVCGLALIYCGRPWVAVFGCLGLLAGFCYSASPLPLMSLGLGEVLIFLAFGPLLTLGPITSRPAGWPRWGPWWACPWPFSSPPSSGSTNSPTWRRTWPRPAPPGSPAGLEASRWLYAALMLAPFVSLFVLLESSCCPTSSSPPWWRCPWPCGPSAWSGATTPPTPSLSPPGPDHPDPFRHRPDPDPGPALRRLVAMMIAVSFQLLFWFLS